MIRKFAIILSILGLIVSSYLLYTRLTETHLVCGISSCDIVNNSKYAFLLGIPVSAWGVVFYLVELILLFIKKYKLFFWGTIIGVVFSAYLTYLEFFVIYSWCQWCLLSAWITVALFVLGLRLQRIKYYSPKLTVPSL